MKRSRHAICSVVGCKASQVTLHRIPASEETKAKWLDFIFKGNVPETVGKNVLVCAKHFSPNCYKNLGQYEAGLASKLYLIDGAVPSIRHTDPEAYSFHLWYERTFTFAKNRKQTSKPKPDEEKANNTLIDVFQHYSDEVDCYPNTYLLVNGESNRELLWVSTYEDLARVHHVACQTDPPKLCTVATQLSITTLRPHYRSTGVQVTIPCPDVSTSEPPLSSAPIKMPRLELKEEEEDQESHWVLQMIV